MRVVLIIFALMVIGAAGIAIYFINQSPKDSPNIKQDLPSIKTPSVNPSTDISDSVMKNEVNTEPYFEYSKESFSGSENKTRILFFYADWCPICRPVDRDIKDNLDKIPDDISIIKVNYNDQFTDEDEKKLAAKYGVTYQHTFVRIDTAGNEIEKWNGGSFEDLLKRIQSASGQYGINNMVIPVTDGAQTP